MPIRTNLPNLESARKRLAKEIVLLSKGFLDKKAFPEGRITVYPWDLITNEALIKRGFERDAESTLIDLLPLMCNLNGAKSEDFYVSEVMLILMVCYAQGQSGNIVLSTKCPFCKADMKVQVNVPDNLEKIGEKTPDWPGYDTVILPQSHDVIEFRPLKIGDVKKIKARTPEDRLIVRDEVFRHALHIVTVGNGKEKGAPDGMQEAARYIEALSMADIKAFLAAIRDNSPTLRDSVGLKCDKCEKESEHSLGIDAKFFL